MRELTPNREKQTWQNMLRRNQKANQNTYVSAYQAQFSFIDAQVFLTERRDRYRKSVLAQMNVPYMWSKWQNCSVNPSEERQRTQRDGKDCSNHPFWMLMIIDKGMVTEWVWLAYYEISHYQCVIGRRTTGGSGYITSMWWETHPDQCLNVAIGR